MSDQTVMMAGKDYWTKRIRLRADDSLAIYIRDNGIDMTKYEIVEPEEVYFDCD